MRIPDYGTLYQMHACVDNDELAIGMEFRILGDLVGNAIDRDPLDVFILRYRSGYAAGFV